MSAYAFRPYRQQRLVEPGLLRFHGAAPSGMTRGLKAVPHS
jgi:hypothetical protein